ncbi:MAG: hypothetical protein N3E36_02685 [Sulfolobales archaeon]|nr:hypothetical protein [Sulfolobales archaeon]MCX8198922.1 hypothetical protein [Sulfolobales archaeon]MDW8169900.1 hypothetical protein [Desulfurococcaceae archaeon]
MKSITATLTNVAALFNGENIVRGVRIVISSGVIECIGLQCISKGRAIDKKLVATPSLSDSYISLSDVANRLGLTTDNLSNNDYVKLLKIVCLEEFAYGVTEATVELEHAANWSLIDLPKECRRIYIKLISSKSTKARAIDLDLVEPSELIELISNAGEVYLKLSLTKSTPILFRRKTGQWPLEFLNEKGLLNGRPFKLVYANYITSREMEIISRYSSNIEVLVSPSKTMASKAGGFAPVYELAVRHGVRVRLSSSGLTKNILNEVRELLLLTKYVYQDDRFEALMALKTSIANKVLEGEATSMNLYRECVDSIDTIKCLIMNSPKPSMKLLRPRP